MTPDKYTTGDVTVTGFIEADVTIGQITQSKILSWEFSIAGEEECLTIASPPTFGD